MVSTGAGTGAGTGANAGAWAWARGGVGAGAVIPVPFIAGPTQSLSVSRAGQPPGLRPRSLAAQDETLFRLPRGSPDVSRRILRCRLGCQSVRLDKIRKSCVDVRPLHEDLSRSH